MASTTQTHPRRPALPTQPLRLPDFRVAPTKVLSSPSTLTLTKQPARKTVTSSPVGLVLHTPPSLRVSSASGQPPRPHTLTPLCLWQQRVAAARSILGFGFGAKPPSPLLAFKTTSLPVRASRPPASDPTRLPKRKIPTIPGPCLCSPGFRAPAHPYCPASVPPPFAFRERSSRPLCLSTPRPT